MGKIQKLDWGMIDWIFEPEESGIDNMRVGISTMLPHTSQPRHIHCGDEQFNYVISGCGRHWIGGQEGKLEPGLMYHISAGLDHESVNDGDEPIVKLLISIPALTGVPQVRMNDSERVKQQESIDKKEFLHDTVKELFRSMLAPLKMALAIFSYDNELIYRSKEYPEFCCRMCRIDQSITNCPLINRQSEWILPYYEGTSAFICEHGLWVYSLAIIANGELLGFVKAGHVRTETSRTAEEKDAPYEVPESTIRGIIQVIHKIAESIINHYKVCSMQVELQHRLRLMTDQKKEEYLLQESLKTTQEQAFNLQINQHFLFNTLNTIAGMAIRENAIETYQAVGNLAQLLRYTLRTNSYFVSLGEEIEYLRNYTNLQQMRFGKRLEVHFQIPVQLFQLQVPFNFIQPIVENCFNHGFKNKKDKMTVLLKADYSDSKMLTISIADNGTGMSQKQLQQLRNKISTGMEPHGTIMIVRKLESFYGNSFSYQVDSDSKGTKVEITIPAGEVL